MAEISANFGDREIMDDALDSERAMTSLYNTSAGECAGSALRKELVSLLCAEHQLQAEVFDEMTRRGWYSTKPAQSEQIKQVKERFMNSGS